LYKYILISNSDDSESEFRNITKRTSPVYDYSLGEDKTSIASKHICLPIWYKLEQESIDAVIDELKKK